MKLIDFYDKRLPKGCRILPSCISCMAYCKWHKVKLLEYNTDTSAGHPVKDDDIVRYSLETRRVNDKKH